MNLPSTDTDVPELLRLRHVANHGFVAVLWGLAALITGTSYFSGMSVTFSASVTVLGAVLATFMLARDPDGLFGRLILVVCLMNDYDALIYATSYTPYQLDAHMLYFVLAALLVAYCCWITLLVASVHTAVQHLLLNWLLPEYVFPGGADWIKFVIHALVVVLQLGGSVYFAIHFHRLFSRSHSMMDELKATSQESAEIRRREDAQRQIALSERERAQALVVESSQRQKGVVDLIAQGLERLADGGLDHRIDVAFPEEYESLRQNFNGAMMRIGEAMARVAETARTIRSGAGAISGDAEDLSRNAESQSARLREAVEALEQVTGALNKTASGASHARQVVATAKDDAELSAKVVGEAVGAMNEIERSSGEIGQIIGVIDEIAFQTNLLALNAGVEAARAGEFGRGFAVVASEVRGLAQRSAEAAKQIKALISTSSAQVGRGVDLVRRTGQALERIVGEIGEINVVVTDIAGSMQAQAGNLGEVNDAVNEIDGGVRASADKFQSSASATRSLAGESEELERLVGFFRLAATGERTQRLRNAA